MNDMPQNDTPLRAERTQDRLSGLSRDPSQARKTDQGYSKFIKSMRLLLPIIALCILAVVLSWNMFKDDNLAPAIKDEQTVAARAGKNELVNPRFESVDEKNQPYVITANRALQDMGDELMILEEPLADMLLESGNWMAIKSRQGAYTQEARKLLLKDNVEIFHDDGYTVKTSELNVDMAAGLTNTQTPIRGHGPMGTLDANGMEASTNAQILKFIGPAKIVIYDTGNKGNIFKP